MRVSIVMPSNRPKAARRAIDNIHETSRGSVEVIVVSSFDPGRGAVWVSDEGIGGPVATQARGVGFARGEFVAAFADDCLFEPDWDDLIVADYRVNAMPEPYIVGMNFGIIGTVFGCYYPNFPFMRRLSPYWYDAIYRRGFGDCDLGMRAWAVGGRCEVSVPRVLRVLPEDARKGGDFCAPDDLLNFTRRWGSIFGAGWGMASIDDFNVNLIADSSLVIDRTVYRRTPEEIFAQALPRARAA